MLLLIYSTIQVLKYSYTINNNDNNKNNNENNENEGSDNEK